MTVADLESRVTKVENVQQLLLQRIDQIIQNMTAGATGHFHQFVPQHFSDPYYGHYAPQYPVRSQHASYLPQQLST